MTLGQGSHRYEWIDNWATLPDTPSHSGNGRTHGIAALPGGEIVVFCQADPAVLIYDNNGERIDAWGDRFLGAHGLTTVGDTPATARLWLTDQGTCEVVRTTLDGRDDLTLPWPEHPGYDGEKAHAYVPTWVAQNETRWGGDGSIWVADGYGASLIHRYTPEGKHIATIDGTAGAGRFKCPHSLAFDTRRGQPELYVADRGHARVQVFDAHGEFLRAFGNDFLTSPCSFDFHDGLCLVPELFGSVALLDEEDAHITRLGHHPDAKATPGWPNVAAAHLKPGQFNSPHDACFDAQGNIYVAEWIVGGRITKLAKV